MSESVFAFDKVPFERRLAETIAWCAPRAREDDPKHSLRFEGMRPSILERDRASAVQSVTGYAGESPTLTGRESLRGGRLLVYFPDADSLTALPRSSRVASSTFITFPRGTRGSLWPTTGQRLAMFHTSST